MKEGRVILSVTFDGTEYRCKEARSFDGDGKPMQRRSAWLSADRRAITDDTAMKCLEVAREYQRRLEHDKNIQELRAELWPEGSRS